MADAAARGTMGGHNLTGGRRDDPADRCGGRDRGDLMIADASAVATGVPVQTTDCRVWWIDPTEAPTWCEELLSEPERARAESFQQVAARRRFTVATALVKVTVARLSGCDPFDVKLRRQCPDCRGPHGRPEVVGGTVDVSISHSGGRVAVALCADGPVGVDVEQVDADVDVDSMLRFVLGDAERPAFSDLRFRQARLQAFFQCWTRKESVLKATGDGLRIPMSNVTLGPPHDRARLIGFTKCPQLVGMAQIVDLHPGPGYVGAVTVLSARPVRVWELDGADAFATSGELIRDGLPIAVR
jgi:4'-phosphopantetheinyl transferase